jgi:CBS domain-containing protein
VAHRISGVPVVDEDGYVFGVVTEADILMKERTPPEHSRVYAALYATEGWEGELRLDARTAGEAMSTPARVIGGDRPVAEAASRMLDEEGCARRMHAHSQASNDADDQGRRM